MNSAEDNDILLKRLKQGDKDAFTQIYSTYHPKLCRYLFSISRDETLSEDIVQEQLMHLWIKRDTQIIVSLNAYLYRSVYNKFLNHCNTEKRQLSLKEKLRMQAVIEVESTDSTVNKKRLKLLKEIIEKLPEKRREIFILSKLNNYEYKEIAAMRNISERTVESQIRKALITIREEVARLKDEGDATILFLMNYFF